VDCEDVVSWGTEFGVLACLSVSLPSLQALGYLPPELPSTIRFGNNQEMYVTAKVLGNSSKDDSGSMLHGKVMVFSGQLSDNTPAIAKLPATDALLQREVCKLHLVWCC